MGILQILGTSAPSSFINEAGSSLKFPKTTRVKLKKLPPCPPCYICNKQAVWHHIVTRAAGGGDQPSNLINLCVLHHHDIHLYGTKDFMALHDLPIHWVNGYPQRNDL